MLHVRTQPVVPLASRMMRPQLLYLGCFLPRHGGLSVVLTFFNALSADCCFVFRICSRGRTPRLWVIGGESLDSLTDSTRATPR